MSVTRTPVNPEPTFDPTDPDSFPETVFYRDLEHHLKARALYEAAKDAADRYKDRTKANVEAIGDKDNTGSYVVSFEESDEGYLTVAGEQVKFVKSEKYKKSKGGINPEKAKELLSESQWEQSTTHVISIEVPGHAPVKEIVAAVKETLKDADITDGFVIDPNLVIDEDKVTNLNYFDGPDQITDKLLKEITDDDEYATRLIVNKKKK